MYLRLDALNSMEGNMLKIIVIGLAIIVLFKFATKVLKFIVQLGLIGASIYVISHYTPIFDYVKAFIEKP